MLWLWPATLVVLFILLASLLWPLNKIGAHFEGSSFVWVLSLGFPLLLYLVAFLLRYDGPNHPEWEAPPEWRHKLVLAVLILHVIAVLIYSALKKGRRVRVLAMCVPGVYLSFAQLLPAQCMVLGACI